LSIPVIPARLTKPKDDDNNNKPDEDPVLKQLCGCSPDISVTNPSGSSWLDLVAAAYPDVQRAAFAANILAMCNRAAKFVDGSDKKLVAAGQTLCGIYTTIKGKSYQQFLNDANLQAEAVKAEIAAKEETTSAPKPAAADDTVSTAQTTTCAINTALSTAVVRDVTLTNSCPVYTNG
jgi:hypothetical protein